MQIQPPIAAGAAAGSVSQASAKDRSGSSTAADATTTHQQAAVERVERGAEANADRDAQGAGPGLDTKRDPKQPTKPTTDTAAALSGLPVREPEPPGQLDILG